MSDQRPTKTSSARRVRALLLACGLAAAIGPARAVAQEFDPFGDPSGQAEVNVKRSDREQAVKDLEGDVRVSEHLTVDLHVQDEDLANVLQMLSLQSQRNIVVSNDVSAQVSANLYDVTFYEALDAILNVNGYGYIERGNFLYVYTLEEIAQIEEAQRQPVSKVIRLNYLNANDAAEFVSPLLSEIGQIKTNGDVEAFQIPENAPVGDETYALAATMVVYDYEEHVAEIESLVKQLDTRPQQVLIEATIVETALSEQNAFGIDFSIIGDVDFTDFTQIGGPLGAASGLQQGGDGTTGGFSPADNQGTAATSTAGNTGGPATFRLGVINDDFSIFLRLLDEVSDTTVLSSPKILALNRQPARVLVGERIGYLSTSSTETSTTQTVQFLDTGTQLSFRPFVSNDGLIRMELSPSVSQGRVENATDVNGSVVTIPNEVTQEVTTNVIVRDGNTIVLGGLFREQTTQTRRQVPIVGDIPLIGAAFRGHEDDIMRSEIIFLITPTIMNDERLLEQGERALADVERVRAGTRNGLLPFSRERMTAQLNLEAERHVLDGDPRKALWKLSRSLELNPRQPEAIRLKEALLAEQEIWPSRSVLEDVYDDDLDAMLESIEPVSLVPHPAGNQLVAVPKGEEETFWDVPADSGAPVYAEADEDGPLSRSEPTPGDDETDSFVDLDDARIDPSEEPAVTLVTPPSGVDADSAQANAGEAGGTAPQSGEAQPSNSKATSNARASIDPAGGDVEEPSGIDLTVTIVPNQFLTPEEIEEATQASRERGDIAEPVGRQSLSQEQAASQTRNSEEDTFDPARPYGSIDDYRARILGPRSLTPPHLTEGMTEQNVREGKPLADRRSPFEIPDPFAGGHPVVKPQSAGPFDFGPYDVMPFDLNWPFAPGFPQQLHAEAPLRWWKDPLGAAAEETGEPMGPMGPDAEMAEGDAEELDGMEFNFFGLWGDLFGEDRAVASDGESSEEDGTLEGTQRELTEAPTEDDTDPDR
jgi:type IV pilus assembly protein PilQ